MLVRGARPRPRTPRHALEVFLAILGLFLLSLLGTSRYAYRFRRHPIVATLVGGGWLSVLIGMLIGPEIAGLVSRDTILQTVPLLTLGLGWVGFLAGFQVRFSVLREVPRSYFLTIGIDAALTAIVIAGVGWVLLGRWASDASQVALWVPLVFIISASLGWKLETRSVGLGTDPRAALLARATGTLLGILAILAFGLAAKTVERDGAGQLSYVFDRGALKLVHTLVLAAAIGGAGRYLVKTAGNSFGYKLAIFLGIVTFTAGSATQIGASPLIASMLAGVVFSNIKPDSLDDFERFILRAEHVMAVLFGVLVGILMDPGFSAAGWAIVAIVFAVRLVVKPLAIRMTVRASTDTSAPGVSPLAQRRLMLACVRQSPIMLVLGVSLVLIEPSVFHKQLLAVLVFVGVASEVVPALVGLRAGRSISESEPGGVAR